MMTEWPCLIHIIGLFSALREKCHHSGIKYLYQGHLRNSRYTGDLNIENMSLLGTKGSKQELKK